MRFIPLLLLLLTACTTTDTSPSQNYMLGKEELRITGNVVRKPDLRLFEAKNLTVFINGQPVINGNLSDNWAGELSGEWRGHRVTALCTSERKNDSWIAVSCPILIDEKRTVTLTF